MPVTLIECIISGCNNTISNKGFTKLDSKSFEFHNRLFRCGWRYDAQLGGWRCSGDSDYGPYKAAPVERDTLAE